MAKSGKVPGNRSNGEYVVARNKLGVLLPGQPRETMTDTGSRTMPRLSRKCMARFVAFTAIGFFALISAAAAGPSNGEIAAMKAHYQRPATIPYPKDNPFSTAKAALGRELFFDPRLSGAGKMSYATCHSPTLAWGDGMPKGLGAAGNRLDRHSPTILNLAFGELMFWDGRAESLEEQSVGPIQNPAEMANEMPRLIAALRAVPAYQASFAEAFPNQEISAATIAKALATFERTIVSSQAPFDRWIRGDDNAISEAAKRGFVTFNTTANCAACHSGWRFTDDSFHDIGLPDDDLGRGGVIEGIPELQHAFKTPTLRNIAQRAPFMHNGSITTLAEVVRHYAGRFVRRPSLAVELHRLDTSNEDVQDLVAFLETLTSVDTTLAEAPKP